MKKTLLLSIVASTLIFAGGDIAPVEPAVVVPAPVAESNWKFSGQGVVYYQTMDVGDIDFFDQEGASANAGLQLTATNDNLIGGVGFGAQINGLGTLGLEEDVVTYPMQMGDSLNSAYISQLYLTYGFGNTNIKVGRQELPKALSPFAYSEDWNVFKNTFNAALIVNNDIPNTTVALAYVRDANWNGTLSSEDIFNEYAPVLEGMNEFNSVADGAYMLTVQNKSIENTTLTGSFYEIKDLGRIFWADAQYDASSFNVGLQGGVFNADDNDDWKAYGIKAGTTLGGVNLMAAYSVIDPKDWGWMYQVGGTTSPLYTDMIADEILGGYYLRYPDNSGENVKKYKIAANMGLLGGNISAAYGVAKGADYDGDDLKEFDLYYTRNVTNDISLSAAYANISTTNNYEKGFDLLRVVARYNF